MYLEGQIWVLAKQGVKHIVELRSLCGECLANAHLPSGLRKHQL